MSDGDGDKGNAVEAIPELEIKVLKPAQKEEKKGGVALPFLSRLAANPAMILSFLKLFGVGMACLGLASTYMSYHGHKMKEAKIKLRKSGLSGLPVHASSAGGPGGPTSSLGFLKYANPNFKFDDGTNPKAADPAKAAANGAGGYASADGSGARGDQAAANPMGGMMDQMKAMMNGAQPDADAQKGQFKGKQIGQLSSSIQSGGGGPSMGGPGFGSMGGQGGFGSKIGNGFSQPNLKGGAPGGSLAMPKAAPMTAVRGGAPASAGKGKGLAALRALARSQHFAMSSQASAPAYQTGVADFDGGANRTNAITGAGTNPTATPEVAMTGGGGGGGGGSGNNNPSGPANSYTPPNFTPPGGGATGSGIGGWQIAAQVSIIAFMGTLMVGSLMSDEGHAIQKGGNAYSYAIGYGVLACAWIALIACISSIVTLIGAATEAAHNGQTMMAWTDGILAALMIVPLCTLLARVFKTSDLNSADDAKKATQSLKSQMDTYGKILGLVMMAQGVIQGVSASQGH